MRIQHNIMTINAYRNYTNNVSAMKANLEKLSSGYKINRAGDDAAGLAISEKMRAQITGLETAQKNAKDGISLVQTAEGALTEVHDMLNRMVELATQSANGTYDNDTDRAQLQKEMDQLRSEINRIADSSNFNGIKLLDGSMSTDPTAISGADRIIEEVYAAATDGVANDNIGVKTILDGASSVNAATKFSIDFTGLTAKDSESASITATGTADNVQTDGSSDDDTFTAGGALLSAIKADSNYGDLDLDSGNASIKVDYGATDTGKWSIVVSDGTNDVTITANSGTLDADGKTLLLQDDQGNTLLSIQAASDTLNAGGSVTATTFEGAYNAAKDTGLELSGSSTPAFNVKLNGSDLLSDDIALDDGDDAATIAAAVLAQLDIDNNGVGSNAGDGTGTEVELNWNGANYKVTVDGNKLVFDLQDDPTADNIKGDFDWDMVVNGGEISGHHTAGTTVEEQGSVKQDSTLANTVFRIDASDIKDGTTITIDGKTVTLAVGADSKIETTDEDGNAVDGVIDLTGMDAENIDLDVALGKISQGFVDGTDNFIVGVNNKANGDALQGLTVAKKADSENNYTTKDELAEVFSMGVPSGGTALTLQIGDTADSYNQLTVDISDCHAAAMGIGKIDISTQEGAAAAVEAIKKAVNYVSDVRGTLGTTQNRLDHTINNLSVMTENIQDAESTIRDVDIAEEMMAYTKNNILIQASQAMLAQANQVPQGVLQLLQ